MFICLASGRYSGVIWSFSSSVTTVYTRRSCTHIPGVWLTRQGRCGFGRVLALFGEEVIVLGTLHKSQTAVWAFQELLSQRWCRDEGLKDKTQQSVLHKYLYFIDIMQMGTEYLPPHWSAFSPGVIEEHSSALRTCSSRCRHGSFSGSCIHIALFWGNGQQVLFSWLVSECERLRWFKNDKLHGF